MHTAYSQFPNRRRVVQACVNCRMRKTRCDAVQPRCGLCSAQDVDCVYRDARQPKIDYNTQVLLERMQLLEDRILSSSSSPSSSISQRYPAVVEGPSINRSELTEQVQQRPDNIPNSNIIIQEPVFEVQIPLSHTANANHVFSWSLVQELLAETTKDQQKSQTYTDATEVFFQPRLSNSRPSTTSHPPLSWRLFGDDHLFQKSSHDTVPQLRDLIHLYFAEINIFFPLLLKSDILEILETVAAREVYGQEQIRVVEMPQYGLLLVVLCLALLSSSGRSNIRIDENRRPSISEESTNSQERLKYHLWDKARLVLGYVSTDMSLEAAQCSMLAR